LKELNGLLRKDIADSRLQFMTFTKVDLNADYSDATIFWDTFDPSKKESIDKALQSVSGKFRSSLASILNVRHTPTLNFKYDSQYESELAITELLDSESKKGKSF
jgi:ribosome-binding factor A